MLTVYFCCFFKDRLLGFQTAVEVDILEAEFDKETIVALVFLVLLDCKLGEEI